MAGPWRITLTVTADSRAKAEKLACALLVEAWHATDDGDRREREWFGAEPGTSHGTMECGDPGLPYAPASVDLSLADRAEQGGRA